MAYVSKKKQDEDQARPSDILSASSGLIGTSPGTPTSQVATNQPVQPTRINRGGSQFPDISQFLQANEPQAQRMAAQMSQNIVREGSEARQALRDLQGKFDKSVAKNRVDVDKDLLARAKADPTQFFGYQSQTMPTDNLGRPIIDWRRYRDDFGRRGGRGPKGASGRGRGPKRRGKAPDWARYLSQDRSGSGRKDRYLPPDPDRDPGKGAVTDKKAVDDIQKMLGAEYKGPEALKDQEGYKDMVNELIEATDAANKATTDMGRLDLLRQMYGTDSQRGGVSALDNMLLGTGGAQNILGDAAERTANVESIVSQAEKDAMADVKAAQEATLGARQAATEAFTGKEGALPSLFEQYGQNVADVDAMRENMRGRDRREWRGYTPSTEEMMRLDALNQLLGQNYDFTKGYV